MNTMQGKLGGRGWVPRLLLLAALGAAGCDFLDPTNVENPRTTDDDLANAANPTAALLPGLRAQFARLVDANSVMGEVVSDNFSIHGTGLNKELDTPSDITPSVANSTGTATGNYWQAQALRALASFVIEDIAPGDATATPEEIAEAYYYRGVALLSLGENFSYAPVEVDGTPLDAAAIIALAVTDLEQAASFGVRTSAALARAHRMLGNQTEAATAAAAALTADADFLFAQEYDATSIENVPHAFLVTRALQEMQPLPRLDFLDPKYLTREAGIPYAKAEEMHLILAEIELVNGDLPGAGAALRDAILLAQSRATTTFNDEDPRLNADLSIRPRDASIDIRSSPTEPFRSGLVLTRPGVVSQRPLSGSSLDGDSVAALATADEMWHAFHLARQEILFLEGRRMSDLGIRLPIMLREIDANPNIDNGDPGTEVVIPTYVPAGDEMDLFTPASPYDEDGNLLTTQVTMNVDMNRVLADNRVSPFN